MRSITHGQCWENDLVGVGAGPTNLSLAALIETARARGSIHLQSKFFEKN